MSTYMDTGLRDVGELLKRGLLKGNLLIEIGEVICYVHKASIVVCLMNDIIKGILSAYNPLITSRACLGIILYSR